MNHNNTIRAFVAIPMPESVIKYLSDLINKFQKEFSENAIKWIQPNNIHITLKFLGNISTSSVEKLDKQLQSKNFPPFTLVIDKIGAFPSIYKPRVIWVGTTTNPILMEINDHVQSVSKFVNTSEENETFSPHLTIARIKPGIRNESFESLKHLLAKNRNLGSLKFDINKYCLFQSKLTPNGPKYSELGSYELSSQSE
jgi:2'-5' RNA ligase